MKITFYGHACFEIESDKIHALIDPFIKENPRLSSLGKIFLYQGFVYL